MGKRIALIGVRFPPIIIDFDDDESSDEES
jgi:hypothetical protein